MIPHPDRRTLALWRSFAMFDGLEDATLACIAGAAMPREWPAGTMLFQRGDAGDYLVAIRTGRVRLSIGSAQGRELILRHANPGDLLGELALFDAAPRSADATAAVATSGYVLHRAGFLAVADAAPALMQSVTRYLCTRLRETTDQMEGIALYPLEARLARFFLFTLRQVHGADMPPDPSLRLDITQSEMAAVLGASRPKVNRALHALRDAGAVVRQGDVLLCRVDSLLRLSEPEAE